MNLKYTLCFVSCGGDVLMLYRYREPNRYFWNGVGGKLQGGETPRECVLREVEEETGIPLEDVRFGGIVTWDEGDSVGGMYVYVADLPECDGYRYDVLHECSKGMLAWKRVDEVLHSVEVVDNILHFLPPMLRGDEPKRWHCRYNQYSLASVEVLELPELTEV